jgi:hypothetical protein
MRAIGGNLKSLKCKLGSLGLDEIVGYCPNLEELDIVIEVEGWHLFEDETLLSAEGSLKRALKNLSKLIMNGRAVRLGTDL